MQGPRGSARSIIAVHSDAEARQDLARGLSASMRPVHVFPTVEEARAAIERGAALVVGDSAAVADGLLEAAASAGTQACIVAADSGGPEPAIPAQFRRVALMPAYRPNTPELLITALKLLRDDLFGVEKYLSWSFVPLTREIRRSSERHEVVNELRNFIAYRKLSSRLQWLAAQTTDELLSNALFHAPMNDDGHRPRATLARTAAFDLEDDESVVVRFGADDRYLAVEVVDQWGSLDVSALSRSLRLSGAADLTPDTSGTTGAGIGLALAAGYVSHLVCNVQPGRRTELIALFDLRRSSALVGLDNASFHAVVRRETDA